jgi:hypothetical protein
VELKTMDHHFKIRKLADYLVDIGLEEEACELLNLVKKKASLEAPKIDDWYSVIETVDSEYTSDSPLYRYLTGAAKHLDKANSGLSGATVDDIKAITDTVPLESLMTSAFKKHNLVKYANIKNEDAMIKSAEFCISEGLIERPNYKTANWWKYTKMIGGGSAKYLLPFVSLVFAVINFYYVAIEYSKLMSELPEAGLAWYEPLMPGKLLEAAQESKDEPDLLKKIAKATKTSKVFVDELISLTANSIDGLKDIIFLVLDLLTAGTSIAIDLGISFLIMCIEWAIEGIVLPYYDKGITFIRTTATDKIKEHFSSSLDNKFDFPELEGPDSDHTDPWADLEAPPEGAIQT